MRLYTSIWVPEVLAWGSDATNPVGAEYIIMEMIPGVPLAEEQWKTMSALDRYRVIDRIVEMEKELGNLQFPAYGRTSLLNFALSIPEQELTRIANEQAEVQDDLNNFSEGQSINEYRDLLTKVKDVLPILAQDPSLQSAQAAPLFIQAQFAEFLRPPKGYNPGNEIPNPEQKERAIKDKTLATQSKYYEMSRLTTGLVRGLPGCCPFAL
ncbi:uncharacterized protein P174DRAFT_513766 [Aspergillus novofumigatus IBT 16806]|uniref:Aminoglycoside phosphotransferase domain-containing protein n=1 Tax=Aspergillus novofumigatus (strain IBT 16806) TaxID=1392255 RepID=A0A2I1C6Y2_ASPN1|nr:uncharacterized protein P174DRAFT_513766 [Aspergillus novofumigatus IBT 16806]PKX93375.1 hypothetical protein P174DRAFT_513766 [Aspergillus novofumigatus IBT 16806]